MHLSENDRFMLGEIGLGSRTAAALAWMLGLTEAHCRRRLAAFERTGLVRATRGGWKLAA